MATSLQRQLASLQASRSNELDLKAQKASHAKSLLFEPAVAAAQSFDTVFPICRDGFVELCALDDRFSLYKSTLFSPQSKSQDRNILTAAENEELDSILESFLGLVGAVALLKPAQKAVEWLIRRFRVHELNTEALVMTFLPHHLAPIFVTILSILPAKLPPSLRSLHRYASALSNPPLSAFVQAAVQDSFFFTALNRYVLNTSRSLFSYHALISMWTSVMVQSTHRLLNASKSGQREVQRQRIEDLLTRILPFINEALTLKNVPELITGCHMTIIVMVRNAELDERMLDATILAIALSITTETCETALACIALIAEQMPSFVLQPKAWMRIRRIEKLGMHLENLSHHQSVQALTIGLSLGFMHRIHERHLPGAPEFLEIVVNGQLLQQSKKRALVKGFTALLRKERLSRTLPETNIQRQLQDFESLLTAWESSSFVESGTRDDQYNHVPEDQAEPEATKESSMLLDTTFQAFKDRLLADKEVDIEPHSANLLPESFLAKSSKLPFDHLALAFEAALPSARNMEELLQLPMLRRDFAASAPTFFSFLAKVWCSSRSIAARSKALQITSKQVKQLQCRSFDFQILIPYVLVGLADNAGKVRRSATEALIALSSFDNSETKSSVGSDTIYGSDTALMKFLSAKDVNTLIKICLEPELEECISDGSHIAAVLQIRLGGRGTGGSSITDRRIKSDQRTAIFSSLSGHALLTNCAKARLGLLKLLNVVDKVSGQPRSHFLLPCLRDYVSDFSRHSECCKNQGVDLNDMTVQMLKIVSYTDSNALKYLFKVATEGPEHLEGLQLLSFHRISSLWSRMRQSDQKSLGIDMFYFILLPSSNQASRTEALNVLKTVRLRADVLTGLIDEMLDTNSELHERPAAKRQRTDPRGQSVAKEKEQSDQTFLTNLTLVMELSETIKGDASIDLFRALFRVLQEMQNYSVRTNSDLGYLTNVTLSALSSNMHALNSNTESHNLTAQYVRPDLLVDCVRQTTSPQTRNSALLLLSGLARQSPQVVLQSVMPIFTMMSATTFRLSDDFSTHVVDQTIQDVVPILARKLHEQKKNLVSAAAEILLSFAASFDHIAPHRRLQLFSLLASSLGAEESLFAIIATLCDRFPANNEVLKFASTLLRHFGSTVSLVTIRKTLDLVTDGLEHSPSLFHTLIKQDAGSGGRERPLKNLMSTILALLKDRSFQAQLEYDLKIGGSIAEVLEESLRLSFECIFNVSNRASAELKPSASDTLQQILSLFPFEVMASSIEPLLGHPDEALCKCMLATLEKRIRSSQQAKKQTSLAITRLLQRLTPILESETRPELKPNALACIDQIFEKFGKLEPSAIIDATQVIVGKTCLGNDDIILQTLSFYCLVSAVEILQNDFISLIKPTEIAACSSLRTALSTNDEKLHNSVFTFLLSLVENIPFVVSEHCLHSILTLAEECAIVDFGQGAYENRIQFCDLIGKKIEPPIVARVALKNWRRALLRGPRALHESIELIKSLVENRPRSAIAHNSREIFSVFFEALDLRQVATNATGLYLPHEIDALERLIIEAVITVVLKVNDTIFRPLFIELANWASSSSAKQNGQVSHHRTITFFNLMFRLSERLRSIFTGYFGYVLDHASRALQDDSSDTGLKVSVLSALTSSFKHDQDDFWQVSTHSETILQPLVSQLSNPSMQEFCPAVGLAIAELAAVANSSEHHRAMNGLLLKLCRAENSRTRLAVVKCQQILTERLGDEWLSNLPEMLPVINELQEDDDEDIERETHKWIQLIEDKLGESLNSMLQ